jgi:hypothetical protein
VHAELIAGVGRLWVGVRARGFYRLVVVLFVRGLDVGAGVRQVLCVVRGLMRAKRADITIIH